MVIPLPRFGNPITNNLVMRIKMSAFIMLVYSLNEMSKALLADLDDIARKEDKV